jgi:hypothetical protein
MFPKEVLQKSGNRESNWVHDYHQNSDEPINDKECFES